MAGEAGCRDGRKESHKELGRGQRQRRLREGNVGENEEAARRRAGGMATAVERGKGRGCGARKSARCGGEWPRRKSAGPGPRSFEALRWLARLDVAGIEPLGLALGFGRRATYSHLARLADAGLVVRAYDPDGSVVAITAAGRRALNGPRAQVRLGATRGRGLQHVRAVSWVAALLTIRARAWVQRARDAPRPVVARPGPVVRQRQRSPPGSRSPRRGRARGGRGGALAYVTESSPRNAQRLRGRDRVDADRRIDQRLRPRRRARPPQESSWTPGLAGTTLPHASTGGASGKSAGSP
jgi:DNA-binding transcriptional ArsR family regulator